MCVSYCDHLTRAPCAGSARSESLSAIHHSRKHGGGLPRRRLQRLRPLQIVRRLCRGLVEASGTTIACARWVAIVGPMDPSVAGGAIPRPKALTLL